MSTIYSELENEHEYSLPPEQLFDHKTKVLLWYLDEYYSSGQNRECSETIRHLMAENAKLQREYQKLESDCEARIQAAFSHVEQEQQQ